MSKKRGRSKKQPVQVQAIPEEFLAEGSGPVRDIEVISGILPADETSADLELTGLVQDDGGPEDASDVELAARGDGAPATHGAHELAATDDELVARGGDSDELAADSDDERIARGDDGDEVAADRESGDDDGELAASGEAVTDEADGEGEGDGEGEAAAMPTSAASMDSVQLKQLVEALVFASDKPITVQRLRQLTRVSDVPRLEQTLADIAVDYAERGLVLQQVSGGYQFRTRPQFSAWVQQLIAGRPVRLSRAQLETLAIIAYRQPITRPEIDDIRGVDSSATLKLLMDRLLIRVLGKKEEVGRPMLYGTTREFLDFFSLGDLRELPTLREYSELSDESRKVMSSRLGIGLDGDDGSGGSSGGNSGGGTDDGSGGSGGNDDDDGNDGGSSGSGGSGGSGGSFDGSGNRDGDSDDLGDVDPASLDNSDDSGERDELNARSLSDLAARVLASDAGDAIEGSSTDASMSDDATDGGDENDESMSADATDDDEDETNAVDAEPPRGRPIIVEELDLDAETRDRHPVTETMTLADAPELERSETRIVDPLIAAEVLAQAETIVSSGESPE